MAGDPMTTWSEWDKAHWRQGSGYVDWWQILEPSGISKATDGLRNVSTVENPFLLNVFRSATNTQSPQALVKQSGSSSEASAKIPSLPLASPTEHPSRLLSDAGDGDRESAQNQLRAIFGPEDFSLVPIPTFADNGEEFVNTIVNPKDKNWLPEQGELPVLDDPETVIVGVIDTGIPLYHNRFFTNDGNSRVLAAWNQGAEAMKGGADALSVQEYLPFGRELLQKEIEQAKQDHATQEGFNEALGLVDLKNIFGRRDLAHRTAHGAHVLDTAAGYAPSDPLARKIKIIAVNLPHRITLGQAGEFLDLFVAYGLLRISHLANAIWEKSAAAHSWPSIKKLRLVVNLSYGRQAGSKDGQDLLPDFRRLVPHTTLGGKLEFDMVLPSGNDNLARRNAEFLLKGGEKQAVLWRILPEDRSSNYIEIWSDQYTTNGEEQDLAGPIPLAIELEGPDGVTTGLQAGVHGEAKKFGEVGRIYCERVPSDGVTSRFKYLICLAPTLRNGPSWKKVVPAGDWKVTLKHKNADPTEELRVRAAIQTDQSLLPAGGSGLSSYFVDPEYVRFDRDTGRANDIHGPHGGGLTAEAKRVKQSGTLNASAVGDAVMAIAGYRRSDGRVADYSAAGFQAGTNHEAPVVALVSDDGAAHLGTMGASARDGGVAFLSGTSFATAQATRILAEHYAGLPNQAGNHGPQILEALVNQSAEDPHAGAVSELKAKHGRIPSPVRPRVSRM